MKAGDLYIENFPPELRAAGKIAAIRRGQHFREFVIEAIAAAVEAAGDMPPLNPPGGEEAGGAPREQGPGRTPASGRRAAS
jgi:hypothetical protein